MIPIKSFGKTGTLIKSNRWKKTQEGIYTLKSKPQAEDMLYFNTEIDTKSLAEFNFEQDKLEVVGIANANVEDRMQERLEPRGLEATDFVKNPVFLLYHDYSRPVGQVDTLEIENSGILFDAWVGDPKRAELTKDQIMARSLIAQRILRAVSVGFIPLEFKEPTFHEDGSLAEGLVILRWLLLELSLVTVPANQDSLFSPKNMEKLLDNVKHIPEIKGEKMSKKVIKTVAAKEVEDSTPIVDETKSTEDNSVENFQKEAITLLRQIASDAKGACESCSNILGKMMEKACDEEDEDKKKLETEKASDEPEVKATDSEDEEDDKEDEKKVDESVAKMSSDMAAMQKQIEQLANIISALVSK